MLLFKPYHVPLILNGSKTQTRRTWVRCRVKIGSIHQCKVNFKKGSKPFAWVIITDVRRERLGDMTEEDARKEGYNSKAEYKEAFIDIYGYWFYSLKVWVVDFELVRKGEGYEQACLST